MNVKKQDLQIEASIGLNEYYKEDKQQSLKKPKAKPETKSQYSVEVYNRQGGDSDEEQLFDGTHRRSTHKSLMRDQITGSQSNRRTPS